MEILQYKVAEPNWAFKAEIGNHRIIVDAPAGKYVRVNMPWRRRDLTPEYIGIRIRYTPEGKELVDGIGSDEVYNIIIEKAERSEGTIVFEAPISGKYEIYYLPGKLGGWIYSPDTEYVKVEEMQPDPEWAAAMTEDQVVQGTALCYEARTAHDSYYPMEVPMTAEETENFIDKEAPYTVIMESRLNPVRMLREFPYIWTLREPDRLVLTDKAHCNEHYVFQTVVCAQEDLKDIAIDFYDADGNKLPPEKCVCFTLYGRDVEGKPFDIHRDIAAGEVLPLWCGIPMEKWDAKDSLQITAVVSAKNVAHTVKTTITLAVDAIPLPRNGDDDLWRLARLFWLNSDLGLSEEVLDPYKPIVNNQTDNMMELYGKQVKVGSLGLPEQIISYYNDECLIDGTPKNVLSSGFQLVVNKTEDVLHDNSETQPEWVVKGTNTTEVKSTAVRNDIKIDSIIKYEADGHVDCKLYVEAEEDGEYDFSVQMFVDAAMAEYMVGMCYEAGKVPGWWEFDWKHQEMLGEYAWLGSVRGGVQIKLMTDDEHWTHFGSAHVLPKMWYNEGKGRMFLQKQIDKNRVMVESCTGKMKMQAGQKEILHFHIIMTPFHPIDYQYHWTKRLSTGGKCGIPKLNWAVEHGGTMVYLHHGDLHNLNINYPFLDAEGLKQEVDEAHNRGLLYKLYYTVRELSNFTPELWVIRTFGDEILNLDTNTEVVADYWMPAEQKACRKGMMFNPTWWRGGLWLVEHLVEGYVGQWHQPLPDGNMDCAVHMQGDSRWHNFYVEGLKWLVDVVGIDGLYLDGIGYDRRVMKRVRRVLQDSGKVCDIDIHCGNDHQVVSYGYVAPFNRMLEHFAYADGLWIGEGFAYDDVSADFQLVETAAIPCGVMSEMLQGGGNPYRGMVFGETARLGTQPVVYEILKVQREFDMTDTRMLGFWNAECPVVAENDHVKATAFVKEDGRVLVAMANWYPNKKTCLVSVNKEQLGIEGDYEFYAPAIEGFQEEKVFASNELIPIEKNKGWIFLLRRK